MKTDGVKVNLLCNESLPESLALVTDTSLQGNASGCSVIDLERHCASNISFCYILGSAISPEAPGAVSHLYIPKQDSITKYVIQRKNNLNRFHSPDSV